mmetsp:Transcript_28653/g.80688  ORF Transcript_28653/g.80688 Transcript_28653/m.80688 type:complete len:371 (-) Transcript_28653:230-1342(-)|eukprot:CAMPEP_0117651268 /NCGR_PEP_ID=MMETSP0804-20121206/1999_1 /TAXON_ID=1074897 /ORGANISM="Tetraselmis astigmatica, Strain CCMP880" /LENGTH=370 /DNA_ID=CAMNT_0005457229 /DNA_START=227 /DNA_END=1339 /DNA_ORIENTATION=+
MLRVGIGRAKLRRRNGDVDENGNKIRPKEVPEHLQYLIDSNKIQLLKRHFDIFDEDKSGLINHSELADFMRSIGHNPVEARLKELIAQFDTDNNGDLSFGEFVQLWYSYLAEAEAEKLMIKKAFEFFDADESNSIDRAEFTEAMTTLGDPLTKEECMTFFNLVDKDQDGEIDFTEFLEFVCDEGPVYSRKSKGRGSDPPPAVETEAGPSKAAGSTVEPSPTGKVPLNKSNSVTSRFGVPVTPLNGTAPATDTRMHPCNAREHDDKMIEVLEAGPRPNGTGPAARGDTEEQPRQQDSGATLPGYMVDTSTHFAAADFGNLTIGDKSSDRCILKDYGAEDRGESILNPKHKFSNTHDSAEDSMLIRSTIDGT